MDNSQQPDDETICDCVPDEDSGLLPDESSIASQQAGDNNDEERSENEITSSSNTQQQELEQGALEHVQREPILQPILWVNERDRPKKFVSVIDKYGAAGIPKGEQFSWPLALKEQPISKKDIVALVKCLSFYKDGRMLKRVDRNPAYMKFHCITCGNDFRLHFWRNDGRYFYNEKLCKLMHSCHRSNIIPDDEVYDPRLLMEKLSLAH